MAVSPIIKQEVTDAATTYILAGAMVSTLQLFAAKRSPDIAQIIVNVGLILKEDAGFLARFQTKQKNAMDAFEALSKKDILSP